MFASFESSVLVEVVGFDRANAGLRPPHRARPRCRHRDRQCAESPIPDHSTADGLSMISCSFGASRQLSFVANNCRLPSVKFERRVSSLAVDRGDGPIARTIILFCIRPVTMNPPMSALSPVSTRRRVEMFAKRFGASVPIGLGAGVSVGVAVEVGSGVGDGVGVEVGAGVGLADGDGVGVGVGLGVGWECRRVTNGEDAAACSSLPIRIRDRHISCPRGGSSSVQIERCLMELTKSWNRRRRRPRRCLA